MPVHDELIVMVPEADGQRAQEALVQCMTTELYGIPIKAAPAEGGPTPYWQDH